ncbi:MAG: cysteine--tRNA ligase [Nitrospirales bacterium]|nr:cysteine--tRNA ligase [Nitrospirales bacterium]
MNIYNTLTGRKEILKPLEPDHVRMYVCGVTVYDDCHLGHARSAIVFDVLKRYLVHQGYRVTYVRNFTDIDDKIIKRADQETRTWTEVVEQYIKAYYRDMDRLHVVIPDVEPRATDHMSEIIMLIADLLEKGVAYHVQGDVFYEVAAYQAYGRLSGRKEAELLAGARVEVDERKKHPMDFALWKASKPGEPSWESPWGKGRPGWHIECSAMSIRHLGRTFDIHGGGKDLIFPHHENEIAQSCSYTGQEFAQYWVHNGFVTIDQEKMSKSLGNFFTIAEIFDKASWKESVTAEALRYFLLSTHYRSDLNFSDHALSAAKSALDNLYDLFQRLEEDGACQEVDGVQALDAHLIKFDRAFEQSMDDDLNTPKTLAAFQRLRADVNKLGQVGLSKEGKTTTLERFRTCGKVLGLFQLPSKEWEFSSTLLEGSVNIDSSGSAGLETGQEDDEWIKQQIEKRYNARERKDFATADTIRQELASKGIVLEDRADGTTRWKR